MVIISYLRGENDNCVRIFGVGPAVRILSSLTSVTRPAKKELVLEDNI